MRPCPPTLLIIGIGHFGQQHLLEWQKLSNEGRVSIAGLVVATEKSRAHLQKTTGLPVHPGFHTGLLDGVDAVDIITPTATHYDLVSACLPHVDVLVEKPLCTNPEHAEELYRLAKRHNHVLMAGHLFRYHPLTNLLCAAVSNRGQVPGLVKACFTNPRDEHQPGQDPFLEWIHIFDLLHEIDSSHIESCGAWSDGHKAETSVKTQNGTNAVLRCGWNGPEPVRRLSVYYPDYRLHADYLDCVLTINRRSQIEKQFVSLTPQALRLELLAFLETISEHSRLFPGPQQVLPTLQLACRARDNARTTLRNTAGRYRPRVAVMGGGIFGSTCAMELSKSCDTVLFERHDKLLTEASYLNQWRHHSGFHYPRSIETIQEVQLAKQDFESVFEDAILRDIDAYYAVSALGSEITRERYLATCDANGLNYRVVDPPAGIVYPDKLSVCLHTDETVIDIGRLTDLVLSQISTSPNIDLRLGCEVVSGRLLPDGRKELTVNDAGGNHHEEFDFLVNASYSNSNLISKWFDFPLRTLRFDRLELALYRIPGAPRFMMTVLDAPFTSLTSLGHGDLFMLSHIHHSVLASQVPADGLPPAWRDTPLNHENLLRHGLRYLPILKNAEYVESRIGIRTVGAYSEDFDGRPTVVTSHGFGCWSVLGGKIITAVTNAHEIVDAIARECNT
jgi:predicted dehydrogenase/2-polyprenyl-6-methoxyphenol hydroxylase-like FAD-dependent oxidoreductase